MKYALLVALISLSLGASAFAQPPLEQPDIPHDGVGVDYTQPWMNDLLLRTTPWVEGDSVFVGPRLTNCTKQLNALAENPLDPALDKAYEDCIEKRVRERQAWSDSGRHRRPFDPSENEFNLRPVPPVARHPNAQN